MQIGEMLSFPCLICLKTLETVKLEFPTMEVSLTKTDVEFSLSNCAQSA